VRPPRDAGKSEIVFVDRRRAATIDSRRPLAVGLGPDFLGARAVALVPFDGARQ
jgi:hypothetical protein